MNSALQRGSVKAQHVFALFLPVQPVAGHQFEVGVILLDPRLAAQQLVSLRLQGIALLFQRRQMLTQGLQKEAALESLERRMAATVAEAVQVALASPDPEPSSALLNVYAD